MMHPQRCGVHAQQVGFNVESVKIIHKMFIKKLENFTFIIFTLWDTFGEKVP